MRLVFAGTPEHALPTLDTLLASGHEVVAVITRPDAPVGRGRKKARSPVAERAEAAGLPVLRPNRLRDAGFLEELRSVAPDCCAVVAYGALIPPVALEIPKHGWVNLHFSLLPAWRGAAPVQHAILRGDDVTGATTFQIEEGLDTGPVYGVVTESLRPDDTSGSVLARLATSGAELFLRTLDGIDSGELHHPRLGSLPMTLASTGPRRLSTSTGSYAPVRLFRAPGLRSAATVSSWVPSGWWATVRSLRPENSE
jgi:methionyl-tRNA formyltransferase